jgi:hypothetical protein
VILQNNAQQASLDPQAQTGSRSPRQPPPAGVVSRETLCQPLVTEDYVVQSMPDVSPTKWHLAHRAGF